MLDQTTRLLLLAGPWIFSPAARPKGVMHQGSGPIRAAIVGMRGAEPERAEAIAQRVRVALSRRTRETQLVMIDKSNLENALEPELSLRDTLGFTDFVPLGRLVRAEVVVTLAVRSAGKAVRVNAIVLRTATPLSVDTLPQLEAPSDVAVADSLARRLVRTLRGRPAREL